MACICLYVNFNGNDEPLRDLLDFRFTRWWTNPKRPKIVVFSPRQRWNCLNILRGLKTHCFIMDTYFWDISLAIILIECSGQILAKSKRSTNMKINGWSSFAPMAMQGKLLQPTIGLERTQRWNRWNQRRRADSTGKGTKPLVIFGHFWSCLVIFGHFWSLLETWSVWLGKVRYFSGNPSFWGRSPFLTIIYGMNRGLAE